MNEELLKKNKEIYEKLNIYKWHESGITGKNVKIAVIGYGACLMHKKPYIIPVNEIHDGSYHDGDEIIHNVAPDAVIYSINMKDEDGWSFEKCLEWVVKHKPDVVCMSFVLADWNKKYEELSQQAYENGTILISSAGNDNSEIRYPAKNQYWVGVGAYSELHNSKSPYSNYGEGLDCLMYTNLAVEAQENYYVQISHTSGATQCVAGMAALLKEQLSLIPSEFKNFLSENCIDLNGEGWDEKTGYGLFVLPENIPEKDDNMPNNKIILKLRLGSNIITRNDGETFVMDVSPKIENNRTLVPVRPICEALGATVDFNNGEIIITLEV